MMSAAQILVFAAIAIQSLGKVLYGIYLNDVPTPLFVLIGVGLTAAVFLGTVRFRLPEQGRGLLVLLNFSTAAAFIGAFFALKYLPPALFGAIEIGMSLVVALAFTTLRTKVSPPPLRLFACGGILGGCVLMGWSEVADTRPGNELVMAWAAIAASLVAGAATVGTVTASKALAASCWSSRDVLAHRFYLAGAVVLAWLAYDDLLATDAPDVSILALVAAIGAITILVPLLLLQMALRKADALTMMICLSAQPALTFLLASFSPAYQWDLVVLAGVVTATAFLGLDVIAQRRPPVIPATVAA